MIIKNKLILKQFISKIKNLEYKLLSLFKSNDKGFQICEIDFKRDIETNKRFLNQL